MNKASVEKLLREYERMCAEETCYFLAFEQYVKKAGETWDRMKVGSMPVEKQIYFMVMTLEMFVRPFKLYEAFKSDDMAYLDGVLFERAQMKQAGNILGGGQELYSFNIMPDLLAAGMYDRIGLILPEENGMCGRPFASSAIINLFMAIWYRNDEFLSYALAGARKQLTKKNNLLIEAYIEYLVAIAEHNPTEATVQLENICKGINRSKEFGATAYEKSFAILAHAMYNLSQYVYDGEMADAVDMPEAENFCQSLAQWQKSHPQQRQIRYIYPPKLDIMNRLMRCTPPRMHLILSRQGKMVQDVSRFKSELAALIGDGRAVL